MDANKIGCIGEGGTDWVGYVKSKPLGTGQIGDRDDHSRFSPPFSAKTDVAPSINRCCRPQNCSSESEIQQMALQF